jgi:hypothetical protein
MPRSWQYPLSENLEPLVGVEQCRLFANGGDIFRENLRAENRGGNLGIKRFGGLNFSRDKESDEDVPAH